ncbi:MAG: hypothetical protein JWO97_2840 [Acidobacteria bacterium]|nr:hypothetical protein [Acidobacteriota bacterium]
MQEYVRVIGLIAAVLLMAMAASAADGWQPSVRPDKSGARWTFVGCRDEVIEWNCWIGDIRGEMCQWRRNSEQGPILRSENYSESCEFMWASETVEKTGEKFKVEFFDGGRSYFRLWENERDAPRKFTIGVVIEGREVAQYTSLWDRFTVWNGEVRSPMDAKLTSGKPFPAIERVQSLMDERSIEDARKDATDLSAPVAVEFGFWFDERHESAAKSELQSLGCRWLTTADRKGTIGPFPGHCAKSVSLEVATIAKWHLRFTRLAQQYSGRYYGWWRPSYR